MRSEITYAGNKSSDYGLVIERYPALNRPSRKYEKVSVPGRNGDIYFKQDAWNNYTQEYEVWSGSRNASAPDLWTNIFKWLYPEERNTTIEDILRLEVNGYHHLVDTYEPNTIRLAQFNEETEIENSWNNFGKSIIRFDCRPERFTADAFDWINMNNQTPVLEDSVPYAYRKSPVSGIEVDELVGGSVGWNQQSNIRNNDRVFSTALNSYYYAVSAFPNGLINGHKYFCSVNVTRTMSTDDRMAVLFGGIAVGKYIRVGGYTTNGEPNRTFQTVGTCDNYDDATNIYISDWAGKQKFDVGDEVHLKDIQAIDLTLALGSTIADYVYSLEQATAGAGVSWLKTNFPKFRQYNAYDAGSIKSVEGVSAHKMTGKNLFANTDEVNPIGETYASQWKLPTSLLSYTRTATGFIITRTNTTSVGFKASLGFIEAGTTLTISGVKNITRGVSITYTSREVDSTLQSYTTILSNQQFPITFTAPVSAWYQFGLYESTTLTWEFSNIQVEFGSTATDYEPYKSWSYPLDSLLTLRGIPKLDSSNQLYYDGDVYKSDGTVIRNTIVRAYQSGDESLANAITDGTNTVVYSANASTESATSFTNLQTVGTTEEYVTDSIVPVGHNTKYYDNPYTNPSARTAKPCLKVYGSGAGTVVCNGYVVNISNIPDYIYIDSDSQNCFKELSDANLNNRVSLTNGFPVLSAGANSISWSGGVTNVEVMPRWWNL